MRVIVSHYIGPCAGVKSAIKKTISKLQSDDFNNVILENALAHNDQLMNEIFLNQKYKIYNHDDKSDNGKNLYIISAHGHDNNIPLEGYKDVLDCTCPWLRNRLKKVVTNSNNKKVFYLGKDTHPETKYTISFLKKNGTEVVVCSSINDLLNKYIFGNIILLQSTYILSEDEENKIKQIENESSIFLSCPSCVKRLEEINTLANTYIVIGSNKSSNSRLIYERFLKKHQNTYFIETLKDLKKINDIKEPIFITSGSSTPQSEIDKIVEYLKVQK